MAQTTGSPASDSSSEKAVPVIDMETFEQLLEMDDDDDHEFSKGLAFNYMDQASQTLADMSTAVKEKALESLSQKGHFLKGSSAALGLMQVKNTCEEMQHAGLKRSVDGKVQMSEDEALTRCKNLLDQLKVQNDGAERWLKDFFKS